jgi:hypothetical protein
VAVMHARRHPSRWKGRRGAMRSAK